MPGRQLNPKGSPVARAFARVQTGHRIASVRASSAARVAPLSPMTAQKRIGHQKVFRALNILLKPSVTSRYKQCIFGF